MSGLKTFYYYYADAARLIQQFSRLVDIVLQAWLRSIEKLILIAPACCFLSYILICS
jgi:hypothetical protein